MGAEENHTDMSDLSSDDSAVSLDTTSSTQEENASLVSDNDISLEDVSGEESTGEDLDLASIA